ncbi:hypothetical protein [Dyadobacter sp. 32]|uniref:hypothetical protein n=1 Tax=Dyadobacter sp. 32 TaxID=538966 RepID=UPI0011EDC423
MRSFIASLLLFAIMLPTISPWGTVAYFHVNRTYIAKVLCENRDRPKLNCNGKCYLAKKLKQQQEKQDKETTERVANAPIVHLFCLTVSHFLFLPNCFIQKVKPVFGYLICIYNSPVSGLLRPPR